VERVCNQSACFETIFFYFFHSLSTFVLETVLTTTTSYKEIYMNKRLILCFAVYMLATSTLFAQEGGGPQISAELKKALDDCHTSLNITRPARPDRNSNEARPVLSEEQKAKMKADREAIQACVEAKGYNMPSGGPGGHHGPPPQDQGSPSSESSSTAQ
jgi:hypothetical protein